MGLTFGRYRALFPIASGGMAEVHAAMQTGEGGFSKPVAVKRILPHLVDESDYVDMFLDEARIAAVIESPHVVGLLDLGRDEERVPYIVMDLVVGASLAEVLAACNKREEPVPRAIAIEILAQAAVGLHDAHEATLPSGARLEIVHRDVSPQNILIGVDGIARIGDFGIVKTIVGRRTRTSVGTLKGKLQYFSPEQALGEPVDRRTDVFALGVVAWEVFAGRRLFDGDDEFELLKAVARAPIPRLDEIPAPIADVLAKALERDRGARHQTALELATALRAAARTAGDSTEAPSRDDIEAFLRRVCGERIDRLESKLRDAFADPGEVSAPDSASSSEAPTRASKPRVGETDRQQAPTRQGAPALDEPTPELPPTRQARPKRELAGWIAAAALVVGGIVVGVAIASRGSSPAQVPSEGTSELLDPARVETIAKRACREWSRALAHFQQASGAFALEQHREPWGWTTAQELFPLVGAHRVCGQPGPSPLRSGLKALAAFRAADGWTGADPALAETPATAWAILAMVAAARVLGDNEQREAAIAARALLLRGQRADGSFRTRVRSTDDEGNGVSTVLATWALVELDDLAPAADAAPRERAIAWLTRAMREDLDEPPLRATAGLHEQAAWVLLRAGVTDRALFAAIAHDVLLRCGLGPDHRCSRPLYENGQTYLYREPGKRPQFLTLWHPWLVVLARELARETAPIDDPVVRQRLAAVADWGIREIESSIPTLTAAPGYKIAEYLIVTNHIASAP